MGDELKKRKLRKLVRRMVEDAIDAEMLPREMEATKDVPSTAFPPLDIWNGSATTVIRCTCGSSVSSVGCWLHGVTLT